MGDPRLFGIYIAALREPASNLYARRRKFPSDKGAPPMMDAIFAAAGTILFLAAIAYTFACDRL